MQHLLGTVWMSALERGIRNWNWRPPISGVWASTELEMETRVNTAWHSFHLRAPPNKSELAASVLRGIRAPTSSRPPRRKRKVCRPSFLSLHPCKIHGRAAAIEGFPRTAGRSDGRWRFTVFRWVEGRPVVATRAWLAEHWSAAAGRSGGRWQPTTLVEPRAWLGQRRPVAGPRSPAPAPFLAP